MVKIAVAAALMLLGIGYAVMPAHAGQCITSCHPNGIAGTICSTQCY